MHNFKELDVWKLSKDLCKEIYTATNNLPDSEKYGLVSQLNRSVVSIPSNIAEGSSRKSDKDFSRFIDIVLGSSFEVET
ncbi:four helix bundle protein [Bacteroidota bacterium]